MGIALKIASAHYPKHRLESFFIQGVHCVLIKKCRSKTVFLFSHGNAGNISHMLTSPTISHLLDFGSVFLYDYPGYGISKGSTNEQRDVTAAIWKVWSYLDKPYDHSNVVTHQLPPQKRQDIILYGESLGCYPSSWLARKLYRQDTHIAAVVLRAGFSSLPSMAKHKFGGWTSLLLKNSMKNYVCLKGLKGEIPVYICHSVQDEIIPVEESRINAQCQGCKWIEIKGSHNRPEWTSEYLAMLQGLSGSNTRE